MGLRVLLVDDHAGFRRIARRLLELGGIEVVGEAADGREAVVQTARLRPQLVLLDVLLPDMDGFTVAATIAALADPPPVLLISSRPKADFETRLVGTPAVGFLPKDDLTAERVTALVGNVDGG